MLSLRGISTTLAACLLTFLLLPACVRPQQPATQESVVLAEGSTAVNPSYYVSESGEIVYTDNPRSTPSDHNPALPPVFSGAQRIFPANDNPEQRESYLTRAPLEEVKAFYEHYLDIRNTDYASEHELPEDFAVVQCIEMRDESGRRQVALYVNKGEGPRGGMKVMLKEFKTQQAVQIVLTTLDATPTGLNPVGTWVTPEELRQWAEEEARRQEEERRRREEAERQAEEQARQREQGSGSR